MVNIFISTETYHVISLKNINNIKLLIMRQLLLPVVASSLLAAVFLSSDGSVPPKPGFRTAGH